MLSCTTQFSDMVSDVLSAGIDANHHRIIDKCAKEGWRLVQILATTYNGHGKPTEFEAVFERKIKEKKE